MPDNTSPNEREILELRTKRRVSESQLAVKRSRDLIRGAKRRIHSVEKRVHARSR